ARGPQRSRFGLVGVEARTAVQQSRQLFPSAADWCAASVHNIWLPGKAQGGSVLAERILPEVARACPASPGCWGWWGRGYGSISLVGIPDLRAHLHAGTAVLGGARQPRRVPHAAPRRP